MNRRSKGFTLVELLVVIAIIALLVGILLPVLGKARDAGRESTCMSTTRQWALGNLMFTQDNSFVLPYDVGNDSDDPGFTDSVQPVAPWDRTDWWANAVPQYMQHTSYKQMWIDTGGTIPVPNNNPDKVFICPSALMPSLGGVLTANGYSTANGKSFFFCYVPNNKLNRKSPLSDIAVGGTDTKQKRIRMDMMPKPALTAIMVEKRTVLAELNTSDPFYSDTETTITGGLGRVVVNWSKFTARHSYGGNAAFGDGHARLVPHNFLPTASPGPDSVGPTVSGASAIGYNKDDIIWSPLYDAN